MMNTHINGGSSPAFPGWRTWLKTSRPFSLSATLSPILVGTAVAAYEGVFHPLPFLAALLAVLFLQIGTNFLNEYFDYRYGLDSVESLGAATVIFRREMTAGQVLAGGLVSFMLAALPGVYLIFTLGPAIMGFGLTGLAIAYFYSARPFTLASRGLGDIMVYLAMGLLATWGAYFVQIPHWSWRACAASIPVGLLVTAILNMNNVRDYQDDLAVRKRTLPVRFGRLFGQRYHAFLLLGSYGAVSIFALLGVLPPLSLLVWVTFPLAYSNVRAVLAATERRVFILGIKRTSLLHLQFGVVLALGLLIAALVQAGRTPFT